MTLSPTFLSPPALTPAPLPTKRSSAKLKKGKLHEKVIDTKRKGYSSIMTGGGSGRSYSSARRRS
jgi:hypothetical protein